MIVGVPTEIKTEEYRIAITPVVVEELVARGHEVIVESGAGAGSSIPDDELRAAGAGIASGPGEIFEKAELILKVKEPQFDEIEMLGAGQVLFTFLHLAAYPDQAQALLVSGVTAIAYETVQLPSGELPMLTPMSEIAGRMAAQAGANYMERPARRQGRLDRWHHRCTTSQRHDRWGRPCGEERHNRRRRDGSQRPRCSTSTPPRCGR